jgi:hypothetical protein
MPPPRLREPFAVGHVMLGHDADCMTPGPAPPPPVAGVPPCPAPPLAGVPALPPPPAALAPAVPAVLVPALPPAPAPPALSVPALPPIVPAVPPVVAPPEATVPALPPVDAPPAPPDPPVPGVTHTPPWQLCPTTHALAHAPQFMASVAVVTHAPLQSD